MEMRGAMSLVLGIVAGVMFGIVWSKYEDYSTIQDVRAPPQSELMAKAMGRDPSLNVGLLLGHRGNLSVMGNRADELSKPNVPTEYSVGGNSYYLKYDKHGSDGPHSMESLLKKPALIDIASSPVFEPRNDADRLKRDLSVFCIIVIGRSSIPQHGKAVFHTWSKHCDEFIMLSNVDNSQYQVKNIGLPEGAPKAWERTKMALSYVREKLHQYDWYVKAEHDNFVVVENVRHMILMHQANIPGYAGHVITGDQNRGSVVVLSKQALDQIVPEFPNCGNKFNGEQDFRELEACLKTIGITSSQDGRDLQGVNRFQMVRAAPNLPLNARKSVDWYWRYITHPDRQGLEGCCADYSVTFHYVSPGGLYNLEYMVYHMRPFGIGTYTCPADLSETILKLASQNEVPAKEEKAPNEGEKSEKMDTQETEAKDTVAEVQQPVVEKPVVEGQQNR